MLTKNVQTRLVNSTMPEPICPNEELDRLREIVGQCAERGHKMSARNLEIIAEILRRVRDAQAEGRVSSDPNDDRPWNHELKERLAARKRLLLRLLEGKTDDTAGAHGRQ